MNLNRPLRICSAAALIPLLNGCGSSMLQDRVTEGVIEYALTFPEYDANGLMAGMLPERTTLTFSGDKQIAELSAGMGIFKTSMIANSDSHQMDYQLSVLSKKLVSHLQQRDLHLFNKESIAPTIIYTNEVDTIAGYPCKKAVAIYNELGKREIEIFYTDRIEMPNPNWFGPYTEIPGVLLRYDVIQYGLRMRLDATTVTPGAVAEDKFTPTSGYESVAPEVLHQEMAEVLSTFTM